MRRFFDVKDLAVGYDGRVLLDKIDLSIDRGSILCLIGPNGAGKSTILKTITGQLKKLHGAVVVEGVDTGDWKAKERARTMSVLLTERVRAHHMTAREVVALGRYPYTDRFGRLGQEDQRIIEESLAAVDAASLADKGFLFLSDGQQQRILLARALCQKPRLLLLDEPTAFLDIRYSVELLNLLRRLASQEKLTIVLSLHEIDLALKLADFVLCVQDGGKAVFARPEEFLQENRISQLFGLPDGAYNQLFGSIELKKAEGMPRIYVLAGNGKGTPLFRFLQRRGLPFETGLLWENDVDYQVAKVLAAGIDGIPAFTAPGEEQRARARDHLSHCRLLIDSEGAGGNPENRKLLAFARERSLPILCPEDLLQKKADWEKICREILER